MPSPSQPVLWIDPGKMTGLAFWAPWHQEWITEIDEHDFMSAAERISGYCAVHRSWLLVGWEHFTIGARTHQKTADAHHAIEMIGVARLAAQFHGCQILPVAQPGDRNPATRQMLEALGWWRPGKDDAQSAAQHLLAWMLRVNRVPDDVMTTIRTMI